MPDCARPALLSAGDNTAEQSPAVRPTAAARAVQPAGAKPLSPTAAASGRISTPSGRISTASGRVPAATAGRVPAAAPSDAVWGATSGRYYGPPPKKTRWGLIIGLVVGAFALLAVAAIVFVVFIGKGTVTATDVKVGDCLKEIPGSTRVLTVDTVGCNEPHAGEVFAVLLMPEGDFPGQSAIEEYQNKCEPELASYAPDAIIDNSVQLYVLYPTAETWKQGDRAVTCVATLDPPRTGSLKG